MKIIQILLIFILLGLQNLNSQTITSNPEFPTATETVTIYFDATGTGLEGYTGDVYAHTGVNLSTGSEWQHVIGSWGDNTTQPKLTRTSTDHYSLEITPSINNFYNVSGTETVSQLAFVFRSADGSQQSNNLLLDIYTVSNTVSIALPDSTAIFSIGDSVNIQAVAMFADSIKLFFADTLYYSTDSTILNIKIPATKSGKNYFTIIANDTAIFDTATSFYFVRKNNTVANLPSGVKYGINYVNDTSVILSLFAPYKKFIYVLGDFNNWQVSENYQMNITPDSNSYWLKINGLTPSQEYAFQYFVDGDFTIADPYTDKILDPWNDQYIDNSTYPNLKPYPANAEGITSVLQTAQTSYNWQVTNFQRPNKNNLIVYELHIRDFISAHNYQTLIDTLKYLKNLGINTIELMPINEFEGNSSWGYNPSFYFAPDKYYGTKDKLKEFIDVCHQNGIAVVLDMVFNHSYGQSPLVQLYLDRSTWKVTPENPWYNIESPNSAYSWGYDFNHESSATQFFVDSAITYWLTEYNIDGYRFDFTKGFTNTSGDGYAYDQSRIDILKHYYDVTQSVSPNSYLILESFTANSEETILANYGMLIWGNSNHNYCQSAMGYASESDFSWISYKERGWNNANLVGYMESHDEERVMFKCLAYGNSTDDYNIKDTLIALKRMEMVSTFFIPIPGPKMIWEFGELGYDVSIDDPCRVCEKPIRWNYLTNYYRNRLFYINKSLIELKKTYPVFSTSDFSLDVNDKVKTIILNGDTMSVYIVGNFDVETQSVTPNFPTKGTWYEYFTHTEFESGTKLTLAAGEYKLFTSKQLPKPNIPELAVAPQITKVSILGDAYINSTLSATYTFYDFNNDKEGESTYQWYTSDFADGRHKTAIQGANDTTFTTSVDNFGKYIGFGVTPIAQSNSLSTGNEKLSNFIGTIAYKVTEPTIFPNPFIDEINFLNCEEYDEIIISDINGKIIEDFDINAKNLITNKYDLPIGIYFVKIIGETKTLSFKLIKSK